MGFILDILAWVFDVTVWRWWGRDETARIYREEEAKGRKLNAFEKVDKELNKVPPSPWL